jgi:hypothetical protein
MHDTDFPDFYYSTDVVRLVKGVILPVAKQKEHEVHHSVSFKVEVENEWSHTAIFSIRVTSHSQQQLCINPTLYIWTSIFSLKLF